MSIAKRVSTEMGDYPRSIGTKNGLVGYQIRLESKVADENVLVFCTTASSMMIMMTMGKRLLC